MGGGRGKREIDHIKLLTIENRLRVDGGRGWVVGGLNGGWALRRALVMSTGCK